MKKILSLTQQAIAACSILFLATSCIDGELPWEKKKKNIEPGVTEVTEAYVSVYPVWPTSQNVDIVVDGSTINRQPLAYGRNQLYLRVPSGMKTLRLEIAGTQVEEQSIELTEESRYSVFLAGGTTPSMLIVPEPTQVIAEGKTRIRFMHLSPDAPEVIVVVDGTNEVLFEGSFKEASAYLEIPAQASYDLTIRSKADNSVIIQVPAKRLYAGWTYTIMLRGYQSQVAQPSLQLTADILSESY